MPYILSIDQGTTSSRAIVYNEKFEAIGIGQKPFPQHFPKPDWVEHDLNEIWQSVVESTKEACASARMNHSEFSEKEISAIGITNQRETFGLWNAESGEILGRAIVWQCRRSAKYCELLKKKPIGKRIPKITGLVIDPYFSGTKLALRLKEEASLRDLQKEGKLRFGTIDTFLVWKLSSGKSFATDYSNASRTLLMDLKKQEWSESILKEFKILKDSLPAIYSSNAKFGSTSGLGFLPDGIPICGVLGDQQAALFGQGCFSAGETKITYGTGAFLLVNTGNKARFIKSGLTTVAWKIGKNISYANEGSVFIAGALTQWLRDQLKILKDSSEIEEKAGEVQDSDGVWFIPALVGLGSPYWISGVKGLIGGITRRTTQGHIARAALEGVALSIGDLCQAIERESLQKVKRIRVDGGASKNNLLMQIQSSILQKIIIRPKDVESTARGAAYMAALGCGLVSSIKDLSLHDRVDETFKPKISPADARKFISSWRERIKVIIKLNH
jgi:glycerol kinase